MVLEVPYLLPHYIIAPDDKFISAMDTHGHTWTKNNCA